MQEVYFGKTPELSQAETQLSKFRRKYMSKVIPFGIGINTDPELEKFNRMVESIFGFKSFTVYIVNDQYHQAFTFPISVTATKKQLEDWDKKLKNN